jgi:hypothetical protein
MSALTSIERVALRQVAAGARYPAHGNTMRSLDRNGLVEHTSMGWRLTEDGHCRLAEKGRDA